MQIVPLCMNDEEMKNALYSHIITNIFSLSFLQAVPTDKPTRVRNNRNKEETEKAKIVVVKDNFIIILAAIAGALGTAIIVIPIALFCRRTSRR